MIRSRPSRLLRRPTAFAFALAAFGVVPAFGQTKPPAAVTGTGLSALSDDAVLSELAGRQMQGLLNFAFDANKVPESQRAAMMAIPAIKRLAAEAETLKPSDRATLITQIAAGGDRLAAAIDDPKQLMENSSTLIKYGVEPDVNLMEYWGETPRVQNRLKPVIGAVVKMLDKTVKLSTAQRTALESQLNTSRNAKVEQAWTDMDALVTSAEYTRAIVTYHEAIAIPANPTGMEQRKQLATKAIEFLQSYDTADSGVQAFVRNRLAKLNLVQHEYGPANDLFETVVSGNVDAKTKIEPAPTPFEQYEARYFSVLCELMQGDLPRAQTGLTDLVTWQQQAVKDPKAQEGLAAAAEMLRYRIALKERDRAKDPAAKKAAEDKALAVLTNLNEKQPDLRPIIAEQLIEVTGDKIDVAKAEPLVLESLVNRGLQSVESVDDPSKLSTAQKAEGEKAIDAARTLMTRKDPKISPATIARMSVQLPVLYEKLGRKNDAANAYLDYIDKKLGTPKNVNAAFNQAGYLLFNLTKDGADKNDPAVSLTWERFLPIAVNTFGRKEFAYDYANRLRTKNPPQYAEAIKYFRMMAPDDKRLSAAKFREMVTLTDWIYAAGPDKKPLLDPKQRAAKVAETLKVADEVKKLAAAAAASSTDPAEQKSMQSRVVVVTLTQAELAASGEKPDWQNVLTLLTDFEKQSVGLENEAALNKKVMELRVASYVQLKQTQKAAQTLRELLAREPGGRAAGLVLGILQKLNDDYDRAVAASDTNLARDILESRSGLSTELVKWASTAGPEAQKNLYLYKVYDADTQRLYGTALQGEARDKQLKTAMAAFAAMRSPENVAAYKAYVLERKKDNPQDKTDPEYPDPNVTLGMALTSYDLADWKTAASELRKLRYAGKLGSRNRSEVDPKTNETRTLPNEQYWDAMFKYYDATRQWAAADPQNPDATAELGAVKTLLRRDYVAGPDEAGGTKSREGFETLRKQLIPDLNLDEIRSGAPASRPASQPAAPVAEAPNP